jgi:malate dehydrogenase
VRIAVVGGAGGVGASTAFNLLRDGGPDEIVIVDSRPPHITSHVMDFDQVLEQSPGGSVRGGDESDLADADIVVVTAAVPLTVNSSRLVYLEQNAAIVDGVADAIPDGWDGVVVLVTNPVDPLVLRFRDHTGLDRHRVLGYTLNDSLRLRTGIANAVGAAPGAVEAWMIGEHGDSSVPLWSRVRVDGEPRALTQEEKAAAEEYVRTWYVRHVALDSGRSSTWTSGLGVSRMVSAIRDDAGALWPASLVLEGEYGIDGSAVSVPVVLGADGAREVVEWELADGERAALRASAEVVRGLVEI